MVIEGATLKQGAGGVAGFFITVGITPEDVPLMFFILIGIVTGTLAAWPKDQRRRIKYKITPIGWLIERMCIWLGVFLLVLAAATITEAHARIWGAVAFFIVFGGNGALEAIYRKWRDQTLGDDQSHEG
jgi:hypothetical protein